MTTAQLETSTTATPLATKVVQPRPHVGTRATVEQTFSMAWRALMKMRRNPEQLVDVMVLPIVFTVMFTYVFGGAVSGSVGRYLPLIIPGILAQTVLTACVATGTQLREDMDKGVFDRFRSLPIARIAPLAGPMVADLVRYLIASTLTVLVGLVMGYRPGGGVFGVLAAVLLLVITGWSMAWVFTWVGTVMKSAQSVQGTSMMIMFPLTFLSNAFVPAGSMPGWLRAFVDVNPVSHVVTAARDLMNDGSVTPEVGWALLGCAAVIAIFAPLSVRSYRRKL
ncbi:ABC transporter permease [Allobranchiibius sp. GilTou38]|uniref:ABC transporter permease n=1 Tax=Allobranchiibius sp. GilTou38 TaxID=2815210 RepID=UPI001AA0CF7C|nr:ABC transporter permease [Allobranchiibius sp. GilTou38]MBO1765364.1 ABC transporter permease [Allobranchiibius sp. GilTou38]